MTSFSCTKEEWRARIIQKMPTTEEGWRTTIVQDIPQVISQATRKTPFSVALNRVLISVLVDLVVEYTLEYYDGLSHITNEMDDDSWACGWLIGGARIGFWLHWIDCNTMGGEYHEVRLYEPNSHCTKFCRLEWGNVVYDDTRYTVHDLYIDVVA